MTSLMQLKPSTTLRIGGVTRFSATDYPENFSAVIFLQGCPWRCGYCHNTHLQIRKHKPRFDWADIKQWLLQRQGLIDAVVFSGGEPCVDPALPQAITDVKKMGFKVGLHTAGIYPKRLMSLLPRLDWVGLDIKAPFDLYEKITGIVHSGKPAKISAQAILAQGVPYEFRTTLHSALLPETELLELAHTMSHLGVQHYTWQLFQSRGCTHIKLKQTSQAEYPSTALIEQVSTMFSSFKLLKNHSL